ncbi:MAG: response regulator transcription factor [Thermomicrobiales bacterium]
MPDGERPIRILIVDDHPVVRTGLAGMLAGVAAFAVVGEAEDGVRGVAAALALEPDVVLMDLRMPNLDGVGAIEQIRQQQPTTNVLVMTTYDSDADILRAIEAGATGYLLKDTPREELFQAVRATATGKPWLAPSVASRLMRRVRNEGDGNEALSAREIEVLQIAARGGGNKEIARELSISEATVKSHLNHIYRKLDVPDRTAAVTVALERGDLSLPGGSRRS